jgi:tetratricopeptide (TPR) repeat protein
MKDVLHLLESQREAERRFVAEAAVERAYPRGWPAGLLMAHIASWREKLRGALIETSRGEPVSGPPLDIDAFNAVELARNARISLEEGATRADGLLADLIDLWATLGDRPFSWFTAKTTGEALVRNSYLHPRVHLAEHYLERGDLTRGQEIFEESAAELRRTDTPRHILAPAIYKLAGVRVVQGRQDEALELLAEAFVMRDELRSDAATDPDLALLKTHPRFQALIIGRTK